MSDEGLSLLREPLGGEGPLVFRCSARHHRGDGEFDGIRDLESVCGMFRNSPSSKNRLRKVKKKKKVCQELTGTHSHRQCCWLSEGGCWNVLTLQSLGLASGHSFLRSFLGVRGFTHIIPFNSWTVLKE